MATTYLAPDPIQSTQLIPGGAVPANGGQLFFYLAGTSTKSTVYKDNAAAVAHTNPIVLDSGGNIPSGGEVWFAQGLSYKVVFAPSTDSDPPVSSYWTKDNLSGINDVSATASEWIAGPAPTFVGATSFTVVGDQTATFTVGRRLRTVNSGGTIYSTIRTSVFGALTTVTVVNDSGVIDSGLSAVAYSILNAVNPSVPTADTAFVIVDGADVSKKIAFQVSSVSSGVTRTITMPDYDLRLGNLPAGVIWDYAISTAPTGWLSCNGSSISQTTYPVLFAVIGSTWGLGKNDNSTFSLPDLRGRVLVGFGSGGDLELVTSKAAAANAIPVSSNATRWITGQEVIVSSYGGGYTGLPAGGSTSYVIRINATSISFASTLSAAQNLTATTISGTGSVILSTLYTQRTIAELGGEQAHAMNLNELLKHAHSTAQGGTYAQLAGSAAPGATANQSSLEGGNTPFNIMPVFAVTHKIISY